MKQITKGLFSLILLLLVAVGCSSGAESGEQPNKIRLDYAYYSPASLALKEFGWLEEQLEDSGIEVEWTLSHGSNKALEFLNSNSVDFGSTAGAAALLSKVNGAPIKNVYLTNKPEWTALVTNEDSDVTSVADLKGKKVAATLGTDPHIFLLRALDEEGIDQEDVEVVNLQHSDGASSLTTGSIDAWAGLDPHMAKLEIEADAQLFYRNVDFNTYGFLNVREEFAEKHPEYVEEVIKAYEKARTWIIDNPEEAAQLLADEADIPLDVAKLQMERNDFTLAVPGDDQREALVEAGKVLQISDLIDEDIDVDEVTDDLIDPSFAENSVK
ncbi:MAG TPA: aliphatic sulfonate ABC transporter substrate-binding protein [Bacillota bacterium]|nr:aliphatic sulfonate ABC transporter substrate-binding protein [Bacillota bacterium]